LWLVFAQLFLQKWTKSPVGPHIERCQGEAKPSYQSCKLILTKAREGDPAVEKAAAGDNLLIDV